MSRWWRKTVMATEIASGAVTAAKLASNAVETAKINALAVTAAKIAAGAVETAKFAAGAVDATALGSDAVTTAKILAANVTIPKLEEQCERSVDVTVSALELAALNATPKELVAAPGANKALILKGAVVRLVAGATPYDAPNAAADLAIKIENGAGATLATVESNGFIDSAADAVRFVEPTTTAAITPVANKALVLQNVNANEYATGNGVLHVRVYYRIVPTDF